MICKTYQERITREIDRMMVEDESSDLREHLRLCVDCRNYFDKEVRMIEMSKVALTPFRLRERISPKVMNRLPETDGLEYLPTPRLRAIGWAIGLTAAAAMLIVGIFSYSPARKPALPEIGEKVTDGMTPTITSQDSSKYTEQSIVIADIVAVDEHDTLKLNIASTIRGNDLSVAVQVGESKESRSVVRTMPNGASTLGQQVVSVPTYEYKTQFLKGATVSLATANDRTVKLKGLTSGDKVIVMFPTIPAATEENGEVTLNPGSISRSLPWSEDLEKEIREDVARQDERKHGKPDFSRLLRDLPNYMEESIESPHDGFALAYIDAATVLQSLGRDEALKTLKQCAHDKEHGHKIIALCRMLFTPKAGGEFRRPMLGRASFLGGTDYVDWPLEPIEIVDDIPFSIVRGYIISGEAEPPESYLNYCITNCRWNNVQWKQPAKGPRSDALNKILSSTKWKKPLTPEEKEFLSRQVTPEDGDTIRRAAFDLSTPEKAWAAFVEALKSGDEEQIKAVTTEKGRESLKGWKGREKMLTDQAPNTWEIQGESATAFRSLDGDIKSCELQRTSDGWKFDNIGETIGGGGR